MTMVIKLAENRFRITADVSLKFLKKNAELVGIHKGKQKWKSGGSRGRFGQKLDYHNIGESPGFGNI